MISFLTLVVRLLLFIFCQFVKAPGVHESGITDLLLESCDADVKETVSLSESLPNKLEGKPRGEKGDLRFP